MAFNSKDEEYLGDTGASVHMKPMADGLRNISTGVPLGMIERIENGSAYEAWKALLEKYETKSSDVQTLEDDWNANKLETINRDPLEWFLEMDHINRMLESIDAKYKKDEVQVAGHILNNSRKER